MAQALRLARRGVRSTHPNPRVGCVVARGDEVLGAGWHERAGAAHAELIALGEAGERARGATVYVNLEPCCHQGRTPPCTGALIDAGVARVVVAMEDPNPQVAGGGIQMLRAAGIEVDLGLMQEPARRLNRGFVSRMQRGRPWTVLKMGASLDGRTATASGASQWITSAAARTDVHRLRAAAAAIMTGSGTALADDPALTARGPGVSRQPLRVLVDGRLRVPAQARLFQDSAPVLVATAVSPDAAPPAAHVDVVRLATPDAQVDLERLLLHLGEREINDLLVEAGPSLAGALLKNRLVDEIVLYMAPMCLGTSAMGMFDLPFIQTLEQRIDLAISDIRRIGPDLRVSAAVL